MPVTMICPNLNCRQAVVAPDAARGKLVRCAHCNQLFRVPAGQAPEGEQQAGKPEAPPAGRDR